MVAATQADLTIASRYVPGGRADMSAIRYACSRVLNAAFSRGLDIPIRDLSSGFRLYRAQYSASSTLPAATTTSFSRLSSRRMPKDGQCGKWRLRTGRGGEPAWSGVVFQVGLSWLRTFGELWLLRNSILAADYDDRAHDSRIPLQRYWQRSRHAFVNGLVAGEGRGARHRLWIEPHHRRPASRQRGRRYSSAQATLRQTLPAGAGARFRHSLCRFVTPLSSVCSARRSSSTCPRSLRYSTSFAACWRRVDGWCWEPQTTRIGNGSTSRSSMASCPGATKMNIFPTTPIAS